LGPIGPEANKIELENIFGPASIKLKRVLLMPILLFNGASPIIGLLRDLRCDLTVARVRLLTNVRHISDLK
jgi:hypothetical protein